MDLKKSKEIIWQNNLESLLFVKKFLEDGMKMLKENRRRENIKEK